MSILQKKRCICDLFKAEGACTDYRDNYYYFTAQITIMCCNLQFQPKQYIFGVKFNKKQSVQ